MTYMNLGGTSQGAKKPTTRKKMRYGNELGEATSNPFPRRGDRIGPSTEEEEGEKMSSKEVVQLLPSAKKKDLIRRGECLRGKKEGVQSWLRGGGENLGRTPGLG